MTANEAAIRKAYQVAEDKDISGTRGLLPLKMLSTSVPIFTSDFEAAIERYEALTHSKE